jgi:hypothetical protein
MYPEDLDPSLIKAVDRKNPLNIACTLHTPGTMTLSLGWFFLGLPPGFRQQGPTDPPMKISIFRCACLEAPQ